MCWRITYGPEWDGFGLGSRRRERHGLIGVGSMESGRGSRRRRTVSCLGGRATPASTSKKRSIRGSGPVGGGTTRNEQKRAASAAGWPSRGASDEAVLFGHPALGPCSIEVNRPLAQARAAKDQRGELSGDAVAGGGTQHLVVGSQGGKIAGSEGQTSAGGQRISVWWL